MNLYATTKSERASKGQGGNDYLEINCFIVDRNQPQQRVRIINDEKLGLIYFSVEKYFFGQWKQVYQTEYITGIQKEKTAKAVLS